MKIEPFKMERMQSTWENIVDINLAESGIHPLALEEFLSPEEMEDIRRMPLGYSQTNGTPEFRENIARLYPGMDPENLLVTAGSSEANFLLMWRLIEPGDEVLFCVPNYMQIWGILRAFGAKVRTLPLRDELGWQFDPDELLRRVGNKTKLILLTNPNNPTGAVLSPECMDAVVRAAEKTGAWIVSDEVYRGAEIDGERTPSFWGTTDRVFAVSGLSKAFGLPGLRIGWIAGPKEAVESVWPYHDYTTICPSALSDRLGTLVLSPGKMPGILERTRNLLKTNRSALEEWFQSRTGLFDRHTPRAGAICFARYGLDINSTDLVDRIRREKSVLLVPGDHFDMDGYLRIGFGPELEKVKEGLGRVAEVLEDIRKA